MKSLTHLLYRICIVFFLLGITTYAVGQNSPKAAKSFEKAKKLIEKGKYDNVLTLMYEAIVEEKKLEENQDRKFIGDIWSLYARFYISENYYGAASQYFFLAALSYQQGGASNEAQLALQQVSYFEDSARKYQSQFAFHSWLTEREYTRYPVASIDKTVGDTTWFTMNIGSRDSVIAGQTGWFVTIYDSKNPDRYVEAIGQTKVISIEYGKSQWYLVLSDDGKTSGFKPQIGDLNYTQVGSNPLAYDGLIEQLTKFHIPFMSDKNLPLYTYQTGQQMSLEKSEEAIIEVMRDIIVGTAKSLYDPDSDDLTEDIDSGAFKGMNMWEAMLITKTTDVKAFLRYVINYPHRYMGRKFRIDETYATWVINYTPTNDDDANLIASLYKEVHTAQDWQTWEEAYGRYLRITEFDFSKIQSDIYSIVNQQQLDSAIVLIDRWTGLAEKYGYQQERRDFELIRAWVYQNLGQYDKAEELYLSLLKEVPKDHNIRWQLGLMYLTTEDLFKALPEFEFVKDTMSQYAYGHGMYGWTLLKLGRFKSAEEHTYKAYMLDSNDATYAMNHGHSLMLLRKYQEARKYYMKALEVAGARSTFDQGIIADFDEFIKNGWEVEQIEREKTHLTSQWDKHYVYKALANEYFTKGQQLESSERYREAALVFDSAISAEHQGNFIRYGILRNYHRWSAYNYYKDKNYDSSLARYMSGWDINLKYINDPELEMDDLEAISNLNDWLDNDVMEDMFDKMKDAVQRKLQGKQRSNDLYFISIGTNGTRKNGYKHATHDAELMASVVGERAQRIFDKSHIYICNQDRKDSVKNAFKNVIINSKPGDCFILYYTGYTSNDKLVVGQDTIDNEQILAWLSSMSASKKLLLLDAVNSSLIDQYAAEQRDNDRDFLAESIGFLVSDGRVELPETKVSLFTSFLTEGITGNAATTWQNNFQKDTSTTLAYVTSKSLEGFMYGNMSSGNLQFDLKSYSKGVDFPLTFVSANTYSVDTIPPMIYIPNVVSSDGKRGGKTKIVTISKNVGGQALDESGITEITVNGISVPFSQNGKFNLNQNFTNAWTKLVISAKDGKGNIATDSFIINKSTEKLVDPTNLNTTQTNYALLFATSNYDEWSPLENPLKDARRIGKLLSEYYGFKVDLKIDQTIEQMDSIIEYYTEQINYAPKDQLFVFFAGHGHYRPGKGGFIVAKNSELNGSLRSYLEFNDIQRYFNDIYSCNHIMLVFDVCFGGTAFDKTDVRNYSESDLQFIRDSTARFVDMKSKIKSRLFITSGSLEYVPDESQFAAKFVETLESKGAKKGSILTFDDFTDNLQLMSMAPKDKMPTTPRYGGFGDHQDGGEFIFMYKPAKAKSGFDPKSAPSMQ